MFAGIGGDEQSVRLTLYTDAYVVRGTIRTRQRRLSDILNVAEHDFLVIADATFDEFGSRSQSVQAEYAQVNLATVLFGVADGPVEPLPELRTPKITEQALVSVPPFRITGRIHLLPERDLRQALGELVGRFIPVTEAVYWSDVVGEARTAAPMVAVNHARAQILAPHREVDPWAGLDRANETASAAEMPGAAADGDVAPSDGDRSTF
jgi:hypothetical protein